MDTNPLLDDTPEAWDRLIASLGPASMMACIQNRLGKATARTMTAEDVWQDTLLHVWRDRRQVEWRGFPALRRWVLQVAENRIRNASDRVLTQKRGGGREQVGHHDLPPPVASTTPSRIASHAEEARAMYEVLTQLPEDVSEVVRLRLLEEVPVREVADLLGLGESAVKHRLRRGAAMFHAGVRARLADSQRP